MKIYLLNVGELIRNGADSREDFMLCKVDEVRRERVLAAKTGQGRAMELGAGLLLQEAVREWRWNSFQGAGEKSPEDSPVDSGETEEDAAVWGQSPCIRHCTVSGLLSEPWKPIPLTYRYGAKGKPYFEKIPLFFNLSHSGEYVLCAVSFREVGADIQKIQSADVMKLAKRFFSEPECLALERCESDREQQGLFFGLWSRKEAYGKLTGEGITAVLGKDMQNTDAEVDVEWLDVPPPEGYALAVCRKTLRGENRLPNWPERHCNRYCETEK